MEWICMAFLAVAVAIIAVQVFWRYVLGSPLAWTEEVSRYIFIWIVMLGIPIMFNRDIAICFDLFSGKLMAIIGSISAKTDIRERLYEKPILSWVLFGTLFVVILLFGAYGVGYDASQFIYNQF